MLTIDGSAGEGGGQILRTSLALSLVTQTPVRITRVRAGRAKPGLARQHLTAVMAAARVGCAEVTGAALGSTEVTFRPGAIVPGVHQFSVGTAGSATLVLQTVLPALLSAEGGSQLLLEGGTHNPMAPPFDFLERAFLPLLGRMGPAVMATLERYGFYPAGQGRVRITVEPAPLGHLSLLERGEIQERRVVARVANLPAHIAAREAEAAAKVLGWEPRCFHEEVLTDVAGPGNVVTVEIASEHVTEVFSSIGERGVRAEVVGERVAREAQAYVEAEVPVGEHLADQLLLPMALGGGGAFRTVAPSSHTTTHAALLEQVLGVKTRFEQIGEKAWHVEVKGTSAG
ncbi:RNA 3'-terminal phosphate cyclase [Chondromyces apiculatus]|uniref:RNA 3'-terminal phosphate cyclase n=1 Tax=Chondromyces apiculatus DSM 436 TaxID=1192034 RepID=A0A017SZB3_9BACT|nr:RNA 3'-terminal phosphate cyclase [Chondromyces apiculatus]EYF02077.1 RNA 3'-terminal phosphate cyclase [Chondromyces apiculatus DSM 436]